jgi:endoglucanase
VARGLYHNRSGIALDEPYTEFTRPAPHNPRLTPGFAGKLLYTTVRFTEWGSEGGNPDELRANVKGPVDTCTWYQDAGDWDSYYSHLRVAQELLTVYEMAPRNFRDGELNIPESGDGVPDILDEAAWLPRFCCSLRHELMDKGYGTGGLGLRIAGDAFGGDEKKLPNGQTVGQGSWEDVDRTWVASGEDPWSTYRYAGAAAHLAYCLQVAGARDPQGVDWQKEATEAYAWAQKNTLPGDEKTGPPLREARSYAAAALFRLSGEKAYERQFALGGGQMQRDPALLDRIRAAVLYTADQLLIVTPSKRALRWGGNYSMPMLVGQQTTPLVLTGAVGYTLTKKADPAKARQYLAALYTTCDYFLGGNSLNMTWVTGLGPRHPNQVMHLDAWYNGKDQFHPGIVPYGPWRKAHDEGVGPWDSDWANKTLYPSIDNWPGNERWYDNRCAPLNGEFTIHQNIAPSMAIYGFLCAPGPGAS